MIQNYRHKPIDVEGVLVTSENVHEVAAWCGGNVIEEEFLDGEKRYGINFPTTDGNKRVTEGQYLMRSKNGTFQRHNAGFFETMFQPQEEEPQFTLPHSHIPGARKI